ncbi:MAG: hypothetical protein NT091_03845 [Candidatus Falkowbacteria bacterium]|nr:hypothetical protein [Candidatus Falkowbacteria bacterium]
MICFADFLKSFTEDDLVEAGRTWEDFTESKNGFKATLSDKNASPVQFFYSQCLQGISRETIEKRLEELVSKLTINPNSLEVFDILRKVKDIEVLPLLVLSRNNNLMLQAFYNHPKFKQALIEHGVEVIGIIGNQIKFDEAGRVNGIAEHVTKENKQAYVAAGNMLIVDNDETKENENLESGVNAINVQGERFKPEFVGEMIVTSDLMEWREELEKEKKETINDVDEASEILTKSIKLLERLQSINFVKSVDSIDNSILSAEIDNTIKVIKENETKVIRANDKSNSIDNELREVNQTIQSLLNKRLENEKQ